MVYMNVGSGIGGCLVLDGRPFNGQGIGACEIGHTWIPVPGGGRETLEHFASGWAFERRLQAAYPMVAGDPLTELCGGVREDIDGERAAGAARAGDRFALEAFREEAEAIGCALANVVALLCPEVVVVGGGLALAGGLLLEPLREAVDGLVLKAFRGTYRIEPAQLGEDVVVCGALLHALNAAARGSSG